MQGTYAAALAVRKKIRRSRPPTPSFCSPLRKAAWQAPAFLDRCVSMKQLLVTSLLVCSSLFASAEESKTQVYIGTRAEGIYTTWLDSNTGELSPAKLAVAVDGSSFIYIHPNQKFLYSCSNIDQQTGAVSAFKVSDDGALTGFGSEPIKGKSLCHISLDATSGMLMGANYGQGSVVSLSIKKDGSLGKFISLHEHTGSSVHPSRQKAPHAHSIYSGPSNKFAYAPDLGTDKVMIYSIDPTTAKLTPSGFATSPAGAGPRHMKFSKDGNSAYVLNELTVSISIFSRNSSTGELTLKETVSTLPEDADKKGITCSEIRVSKDGKFVYCANRDVAGKGRDSLSAFAVNEEGKLTHIQTIGAEVHIPRNINLDPSGQWLLVAGQKSNNLPIFKINPATGMLSYTQKKIDVPSPMCIEFRK